MFLLLDLKLPKFQSSAVILAVFLLRFYELKFVFCFQLHRQLGRSDVFKGYVEPKVNFQPTYKYDINSDEWDTR